jgi:soluble lytic murein transglycosylase-like protein
VDALTRFLIAGLLAAAPARADPLDRWRGLVEEASTRFGLPARWIEQVIRAESGGRTMLDGAPIRSRAGAIGLMQLMPVTWATMRARLGLGTDPDDPRNNILAGTAFLRLMYDRFGFPALFAAYNAGPGFYARHLAGAAPLPAETRAYLTKVGAGAAGPMPAAPPPLFAIRRDRGGGPAETGGSAATPSIFAIPEGRR